MSRFQNASGKAFDFKAPENVASSQTVVFPTKDSQAPAFAATQAISINSQFTYLNLGALTGACTLNATIGTDVEAGARLLVKVASDGTARDLTLGTGFAAPVVAGVISKTKVVEYVYNGTAFLPVAAAVQID
jgi:hypothetical protein